MTNHHWTPENNKILLQSSKWESFLSLCKEFLCYISILILLGFFFIMPFRINGSSMETNYHHREFIIINRFSYLDFKTRFSDWTDKNSHPLSKFFGNIFSKIPIHIGNPKRGDVVVIRINNEHNLDNKEQYFLKRILGLPWETIRISDGKVFIKKENSENFIEIHENYLAEENKWETYLPFNIISTDFIIPENHYWIMGDNRRNSSDSRSCFYAFCDEKNSNFFIAREKIIGKMLLDFGHFEIFEENNFPKFWSFSWKSNPRFFDTPKDAQYPELWK